MDTGEILIFFPMSAENASFFLFFLEGGNDGVEDLFFLDGGNDNDGGDIFDNDVAEDVLHTDGGDVFDDVLRSTHFDA